MNTTNRPNYLLVFIILAVSTLLETLVSYVQQAPIRLPVLTVISSLKVLLVVLYFMHLKFDSRLFTYLFVPTCILVIPLIVVIMVVMPKIT